MRPGIPIFILSVLFLVLAACNPTVSGRLLYPLYQPGDHVEWKLLPMHGTVVSVRCSDWACLYDVRLWRAEGMVLPDVREFELERWLP